MKIRKETTQELYEMARIGYVDDYELYINTDDAGNIPHFHLRDADDWDKFHTCICIEKPEYFIHGNKQDKCNSKLKKDISKFMYEFHSGYRMSNYEVIVNLWNQNNSKMNIQPRFDNSGNIIIPDYTQLR